MVAVVHVCSIELVVEGYKKNGGSSVELVLNDAQKMVAAVLSQL